MKMMANNNTNIQRKQKKRKRKDELKYVLLLCLLYFPLGDSLLLRLLLLLPHSICLSLLCSFVFQLFVFRLLSSFFFFFSIFHFSSTHLYCCYFFSFFFFFLSLFFFNLSLRNDIQTQYLPLYKNWVLYIIWHIQRHLHCLNG